MRIISQHLIHFFPTVVDDFLNGGQNLLFPGFAGIHASNRTAGIKYVLCPGIAGHVFQTKIGVMRRYLFNDFLIQGSFAIADPHLTN